MLPMTRGRARGVAADGSRRMAPGMVKPHEPALAPIGTVNTTDHDSRVMRTQGQPPLQGYNAQLAVNDRQGIVAAQGTTGAPDFGHLEPMVRATQRELRGVDLDEPGIVVADAGYWHQRQIETVVSEGIEVLVHPNSGLRTTPRPGWTGGLYDFMRRVLATPAGRAPPGAGVGGRAFMLYGAASSPRPPAAPPTGPDKSPSNPSSAS